MIETVHPNSTASDQGAVVNQASRYSRFWHPLLLAVGIVAAIFGVYEIVEWTWLADVNAQALHILHIMRGVISSIVAASVVAWWIIKSSPPLLADVASLDTWPRALRLTDVQRVTNYVHWFIVMRWIAILVAATLVVIAVKVVGLLPEEVWWPLVGTIGLLAVCNAFYSWLLHHDTLLQHLLPLQVYGDLLILTVLLHYSGGIENPLFLLMLFHVVIGGIVLSKRNCYEVALVASLMFAVLAYAEWADLLHHYTLMIFPHVEEDQETLHAAHQPLYVASRIGIQTTVLFLIAYFVTTLSDRLRQEEQQLTAMAERAMAERQLLERSLETTGTGLRVLNRNLQPYWTNSEWDIWFTRFAENDPSVLQQLHEVDLAAAKTLRDGSMHVVEMVVPGKSGLAQHAATEAGDQQHIVLHVTTAPLHDQDGNITQIVELAQDITQQKESQAQLIRAGQLAAVGELAGHVAHEVNNPIAIISAKSRLLISDHRKEMSPKTAQELEKIIDLSDRVARIAQGLLSYCRPSGAAHVRMDVRTSIRRALAMIEQHAARGRCRINDRLPGELPVVRANSQEMEQVFLNLFLNALDAMPRGGMLTISALTGKVQLADLTPAIAVIVEDTGCGIPREMRDKVFEPFFTTKAKGKGTGLGLSICMGLVRSHGGEIEADSDPASGTRFTIRLPIDVTTPCEGIL